MSIAQMIHDARIKKNMSKEQLAARFGWNTSYVVDRWERGEKLPEQLKLKMLSEALDINLKTLINARFYECNKEVIGNAKAFQYA